MTSTEPSALRVCAFEYLTGGGLAGASLPAGLSREGDIMLRALAADLADLPGVDVLVPRDRRLPDPGLRAELHWMDSTRPPWAQWRACIERCDAAWPIAPERGGALARCCALVEATGRRLIGTPSAALGLIASKSRVAAHLRSHGIAVAPTSMFAADSILPPSTTGWVVKPDDGAGAEDTFLFTTRAALERWRTVHAPAAGFVVQPYLPGAAASMSLLCHDGRMQLLACNTQDVHIGGESLIYFGGVVGGREDARARYAPLAAGIAAALPALTGYVGIDVIDGDCARGPVVLDVNARLTTSYAGLRAALACNPAALVLDVIHNGRLPARAPHARRALRIAVDSHAA